MRPHLPQSDATPPIGATPLIGAHVSVAGGLATGGLRYAAAVGAEAIQLFVTNPRAWATPPGDPGQDEALRAAQLPIYVHASYLINLGSADGAARSIPALAHALGRGAEIGARGVVVHTGSAVGTDRDTALGQVAKGLLPLLDKLGDDGPDLLLEPMAGQGQMLCADLGELAGYLDALRWHPRACVCLDTCHVFAAGHDLTAELELLTVHGPNGFLRRFEGRAFGNHRHRDMETRAFAGLGVDADWMLQQSAQAFDNGETQAQAVALNLMGCRDLVKLAENVALLILSLYGLLATFIAGTVL